MNTTTQAAASLTVWRVLLLSQWREHPLRLSVTVLAIALGVALGAAVHMINTVALGEFNAAAKRLVGEPDIVVRGPREGFAQDLFVTLARDPAVNLASPVLEFEVALPGHRDTLKVLGLDAFRAAALQPALIGDMAGGIVDLLQPEGIFLSASAAQQLKLKRGDRLPIMVGDAPKSLHVTGILSEATYGEDLGVMDIASAQWVFEKIGRVNRIDLRLESGVDVDSFRTALARRLPAGVLALAPQVERDRIVTATRAYRVNLNMLALVALLTGAFLVFSTQSLSVLRRRGSLGLLRALGVTRGQLQLALIGEGAAFGLVGSLAGIALGLASATMVLQWAAGDLGNTQLRTAGTAVHGAGVILRAAPMNLLVFLAIGTCIATLGAWLPARNAAHQPPAHSLKGGDADYTVAAARGWRIGIALLAAGALLTRLPALGGLPVFGYTAIAALLFGAVLLVPVLWAKILQIAPRIGMAVTDTAIAQLRENVGLSTLSLASVIVSFSLMVAMAIMVYSFRDSFEHWLDKLLPADMQMREPLGNDTAYWSPADQARLAAVGGVSRIEFRRTRQLLLDAAHAPVTLIARNSTESQVTDALPLLRRLQSPLPPETESAWISEALQDLYGYQLGDTITLPLGGRARRFTIAGVWRDYARASGAIVITRTAYIGATGDSNANEGAVWLTGRTTPAAAEAALRRCFARPDALEILTSSALRERSLGLFDRAFAITYALEAVAVIIGLVGVSLAASSTALARRAEFGMLRHIGMLRRQVIGMVASEGALMSLFGVAYGLVLGGMLSLVLVYVVNRQSFNWSIDLAIPGWQLAVLAQILIAAAAVTALWSGRAATSQDAVRAVREDW
ncbi:MAG: FtsX-like permease family protein [Steroidobacteraceae bacterium]